MRQLARKTSLVVALSLVTLSIGQAFAECAWVLWAYSLDQRMAVFGVPRGNEDDAERAIRAALAMRQSLDHLNPLFETDYGVRLALRVGVATGEAVAAAGTADQFLITGEVANLAARLQSVAEGVVVSEETYQVLDPLLEAEAMPALSLKGFPGPVTAYRVTGMRTAGGPTAWDSRSFLACRRARRRDAHAARVYRRPAAGSWADGLDRGGSRASASPGSRSRSGRPGPRACAGSRDDASRSPRARATRR